MTHQKPSHNDGIAVRAAEDHASGSRPPPKSLAFRTARHAPFESRSARWRGTRAAAWLAAAAVLHGCAASLEPCRSGSACAASEECLANRCMPLGAEPVPPHSQRSVVEASGVAVVGDGVGAGLPSSVTIGAAGARGQQLLLRFPRDWSRLEVGAAFLLLEPVSDAEPSGADVPIRVSLASARWTAGGVRRAPPERGPISIGLARTRPPSVLRIDVTALVRALADDAESDHGFVLGSESRLERGATYRTGAMGGIPRLDVYGRQRSGR